MSQTLSRPKEKIKILLLEGISDTAVATLTSAGYTNIERHAKALDGAQLNEALKGASMVGIRSRTQLKAKALDGLAFADRRGLLLASAPTRSISTSPGASACPCSTRRSPTRAASRS